jgi:hypothetical protein
MHIGLKNTRADFHMNGFKLEDILDERDLGIIVQNDLRCTKKCAKVVNQTNLS